MSGTSQWKWIVAMTSVVVILGLGLPPICGQSTRPRWVTKPTHSAAPAPNQDQNTIVELSSHLIVVPVSVTDSAGQLVSHLKAEDFHLEENGQPQQIVSLETPGNIPIELALLLDISGSTRERFAFEQQAALEFLRDVLGPNDAVTVISIGREPKFVQERTTSRGQAAARLLTIEPTQEATAFFDAVSLAATYLGQTAAPTSQRVLVVISDGEDTLSQHNELADVLRQVQQNDSLFYALNPGGSSIRLNHISLKGHQAMASLAAQTGGAVFLLKTQDDVRAAFHRIAVELREQYRLGYYSTNERTNGEFRRITVRVPTKPDLRIRARQGYYATKS